MNIKATIARKPWILAVAVFAVVAVWMATGLFSEPDIANDTSQIQAQGETGGPMKVQVATMHAEPITRTISVYGRTAPARTVEINAETEGRVESIDAKRGERLSAGQPLMTLDLRDREARVSQSRASVREHQAAYEAQLSLKTDGYVSETQIAETLAKLEAARAELVRARLDLENRIIRAPFDGVLKERSVEVGDFVRTGDEVATFVDNLTLIVTGTVAEQERRFIEVGDIAEAELVTGQRVEGRVRYVSPVADESTRTFVVEMEVDNPDGSLPAGVTAEMRLKSGEVLAHRLSPALLTLDSDGQLGVLIVDNLERAEFVPVTIEKSEPDGVWVSGLGETAEVITVGQGYVRPGQDVTAVPATTETALAAESLP